MRCSKRLVRLALKHAHSRARRARRDSCLLVVCSLWFGRIEFAYVQEGARASVQEEGSWTQGHCYM